ncbi:patatin-like phospholipase family protein [Feifania hominis]|uniref:Patatin-like phospholipase family protein n=1 Tax=Feifania hominis TaxID=2763660 RepID=A0A926DC52_9FIRM|nr:patatin-like phospholipase family protein [Feifania hominis]MBC8535162.1 patatin-like phospholipase family protein [Feifania hominis]
MKLGLALAGGGIRGYAHIGVLKVLEENHIPLSYISGASMGSILAALFAAGYPAQEIREAALEVEQRFVKKKIFANPKFKIFPLYMKRKLEGLVDGGALEYEIDKLFERVSIKKIGDVKIPLCISAVDINSGRLVLFVSDKSLFPAGDDVICIDDVDLKTAVRASSSYPVVLNPTSYKNYRLVDGGVLMNIPVAPLRRMGADKVIAVNLVNRSRPSEARGLFDIAVRTIDIMGDAGNAALARDADYTLDVGLDGVEVFDFGKGERCCEIGEQCAREKLDELIEAAFLPRGI